MIENLGRARWDKGDVSVYPDYRYNQYKFILFGKGWDTGYIL
jgi:hypothetical protein